MSSRKHDGAATSGDARPACGRGLFYTRDSSGRHDTTPAEYVRWAADEARRHGVRFAGTPERMTELVGGRKSAWAGDLFLDWGVAGNARTRPALDALFAEVARDQSVSHVFIPRPDRLARPDDAQQGVDLENKLRRAGVTVVFRNGVRKPLRRGERADLGESITSTIAYHEAGRFRHELADKALQAHLNLARQGFSTGGRSKYGFARWLVGTDGTPERPLKDGEYVRGRGYHVVWLPRTDGTYEVRRRIKEMLRTMPASVVARTLTGERVPAPDAGRRRKDKGRPHAVSGVWHATTVASIGRDPIDAGVKTYGRRSMGDQLRFDRDGPRPLADADFMTPATADDGGGADRVKVVTNPDHLLVRGPSHGPASITPDEQAQLTKTLDERAGRQRGKPRSRTPEMNPLGTRVFDMGCCWPMYRAPSGKAFKYVCGLYNQSHGARCEHNTVNGPAAARFAVAAVAQRALLRPGVLDRVRAKLGELAAADAAARSGRREVESIRERADALAAELDVVGRNLARAKSDAQYALVEREFGDVERRLAGARDELGAAERRIGDAPADPRARVDAAMARLADLSALAADADDLAAAGRLLTAVNANLFFRFKQERWGKRAVRRVAGGIMTVGAQPFPITIYAGPVDPASVKENAEVDDPAEYAGASGVPAVSGKNETSPRLGGDSLRNVSRGDRIRTCDLQTPSLAF